MNILYKDVTYAVVEGDRILKRIVIDESFKPATDAVREFMHIKDHFPDAELFVKVRNVVKGDPMNDCNAP